VLSWWFVGGSEKVGDGNVSSRQIFAKLFGLPLSPHHQNTAPPDITKPRVKTIMTRFRPCIDLHAGSVKQIVGGTLSTTAPDVLKTNWTSEHPSAYYADLYRKHALSGAHVIMLGPGNEAAATEALNVWKNGMQVGGGITEKNAKEWIDKGAERVSSRPSQTYT
jgi:hypothetical protein